MFFTKELYEINNNNFDSYLLKNKKNLENNQINRYHRYSFVPIPKENDELEYVNDKHLKIFTDAKSIEHKYLSIGYGHIGYGVVFEYNQQYLDEYELKQYIAGNGIILIAGNTKADKFAQKTIKKVSNSLKGIFSFHEVRIIVLI